MVSFLKWFQSLQPLNLTENHVESDYPDSNAYHLHSISRRMVLTKFQISLKRESQVMNSSHVNKKKMDILLTPNFFNLN